MVAERSPATREHLASSVREGGRRILLAEDDEDISELIRTVLEDAGYVVETCRNGKEALDRLREDPADLVVLDLMMPVMDGWEFRALQRSDPAIAGVPVVAISADDSPKAAAVHAESYVRKPFAADDLLTAVERVLLEKDRRELASRLEERERLAMLGTIAAGVGHEIANPLSFTMGNLDLSAAVLTALKADLSMLRETHSTAHDVRTFAGIDDKLEKLTTLLQDGRTGAERVRLILRNLQSLGRRSEDRRVRLDLRSIADSSISIVWSQIKSRATLKRVYEDAVEVAGDETRLGQVFLNLLMNACQAIHDARPDENTIVVTIRQEADFAVVEIKDSGIGMSKAQEARVFEPFFTTKRQGEGTGLGLAISREIVNAHGGEISVHSEPGLGSTFAVRLPIWREGMERPSDRPKVLSSHLRLRPTGEAKKQIWIVDDDPLVASAMNRMLGKSYEVLVTLGPTDVLTRIRGGESFDALLCDLMMPEMTGMQLAGLVAAERPELGKRLVFISGGVYTPEAMQFANEAGRFFVEKPFDEQRLRRAIERASES